MRNRASLPSSLAARAAELAEPRRSAFVPIADAQDRRRAQIAAELEHARRSSRLEVAVVLSGGESEERS